MSAQPGATLARDLDRQRQDESCQMQAQQAPQAPRAPGGYSTAFGTPGGGAIVFRDYASI
jgi:hypothetical protein